MKLNKQGRDELRKSVEVLLNASPDNKKIQLSNEALELLLFETYIVNKEKGIKVKLPVWSGDFLRKLDLSRVSFEDVSWSMLYDIDEQFGIFEEYSIIDEEFLDKIYSQEFCDDILKFSPLKRNISNYLVCYANTNAKINLVKSFEAKHGIGVKGSIYIWGCDFNNVDLSNDELEINGKSVTIMYSNCSNTNISLPIEGAADSNLSNNDLSRLEIDANQVLNGENFDGVNLTNTGARVNIDYDELSVLIKEWDKIDGSSNNRIKESLKEYMENYWVGCYLNGKLIKSSAEKKQEAEAMQEEYDEFKSLEFANILGSIAEQMDSSSPKK